MLNSIRVGVLDEQEIVRYGLCRLLADQSGMVVVGSYHRLGDALRAAHQRELDLLLMSHKLNQGDGFELIRTLKNNYPELKVLVVLAQSDTAVASLLLAAGVDGVVSKTQPLGAYVKAIRAMRVGELYSHSGSVVSEVHKELGSINHLQADNIGAQLPGYPMLSLREREVLRLCIDGMTVTQIAMMFERSVKTVSAQKLTAYRKLGLKNDMDLFKSLSQRSV